jgi:hypothetical protein
VVSKFTRPAGDVVVVYQGQWIRNASWHNTSACTAAGSGDK